MNISTLGMRQKALALNLDARKYGTIAEIGGGRRCPAGFSRGGAAGTIATTPLGCIEQPSDITPITAFLASDESG